MPVYNGERYAGEAIESILNQTFKDFEFIIINDGSIDGTGRILERYQKIDNRIHVYNREHLGLVAALNEGCRLAKGKYVAIMHSDDVSLPLRIEKETQYLDNHQEIGIVGTAIEIVDENGKTTQSVYLPTSPGLIGWYFVTGGWSIAHPSVMMRREIIEKTGFYRSDFFPSEDTDLFARASFLTRIANIPEILLRYRSWDGGISSNNCGLIRERLKRITHYVITRLTGKEIPEDIVEGILQIWLRLPLSDPRQIEITADHIQLLHAVYSESKFLNHKEKKEVAEDAAEKIYILSRWAGRCSIWNRLRIFAKAVRLDPKLLFMTIIEKEQKYYKAYKRSVIPWTTRNLHHFKPKLCKFLQSSAEIAECTAFLQRYGFVPHIKKCKNWDLAHIIPEIGNGNFLDMGCEESYILENVSFKKIRGELYGIDLQKTATTIKGIKYIVGDLVDTKLPSNFFRNITCLSVIEHQVNFAKFAHEAARLLEDGGQLFVTFDYWNPKIISNIKLCGLSWQPLDEKSLKELIAECEKNNLYLIQDMDWKTSEAVIRERESPDPEVSYTFGMAVFKKSIKREFKDSQK